MIKIKTILRKSHILVGIKKDINFFLLFVRTKSRKSSINRYFRNNNISKLQIGSNISLLDGWLCSDISPQTKDSIYLDATKKFPFEDNVFNYVYSEHMIEHISRGDGLFMLKEIFRVLKINGRIRIATPDLEIIVDIYSKRQEKYGEQYVKWITDNFINKPCEYDPLIVLNTMFRNWYHCFLYDSSFLEKTLKEAGFSNVVRYSINESDDNNLRGVEKHHLNVGNFEMVEFETMIFEAEKH